MISTDSLVQFKLLRCKVGFETDLVKFLRDKYDNSFYYKVFGNYDVLQILPTAGLNQVLKFDSDDRILSIDTLVNLRISEYDGVIIDKLKDAIAPQIILLKLSDPIFKERGINGIKRVCDYLSHLVPGSVPLLGLGYYEIILWVPANNTEDIFTQIKHIRQSLIKDIFHNFNGGVGQISLFLFTITVQTISYDRVIIPERWTLLEKSIAPLVKLKCAPGHEQKVIHNLSGDSYQVLGSDDILSRWEGEISLECFLKDIYDFRKSVRDEAVTDTVTTIIKSIDGAVESSQTREIPMPNQPIRTITEKLEELGSIEGVNQFLISELINIISMINTLIGNRSFDYSGNEIRYSLFHFFNALLECYVTSLKDQNNSLAPIFEEWTLQSASCLRIFITQHFTGKGYIDYHESNSHFTFSCALPKILQSISLVPEHLYKIISEVGPPSNMIQAANRRPKDKDLRRSIEDYRLPWIGFSFMDLAEGYKIINQGEFLAVPFKDLFSVLNWITLSHEISHGYFVRIEFEQLERDYIEHVVPTTIAAIPTSSLGYFKLKYKDTIYELFAHWFDYKHFFGGDLYFYLWSIWRTWLNNSRTYNFKVEYWARSVFVKICYSWNDLGPKIAKYLDGRYDSKKRNEMIVKLFMNQLKEVRYFLESCFGNKMLSVKLNAADKRQVATILLAYYDLSIMLEKHYVRQDIINRINGSYNDLNSNVNDILIGKPIVSSIPNPFLLLREILRKRFEINEEGDLPDNATLAFIVSFWASSREYIREV